MTRRRTILFTLVGLLVAGHGVTATGFSILRGHTQAEVIDSTRDGAVLQLKFLAELEPGDRIPDLSRLNVVATWEEVGGIQPTPFRVTIPPGCFVRSREGWRVGDFMACGVSVGVDQYRARVLHFRSSYQQETADRSRFEIQVIFHPPDSFSAPAVLGALGGAAVHLAVGGDTALALPQGIQTKMGIEPTPF